VAVADEGAGIAPGEQRLLFRKFYRGSDAAESRAAGPGLGLYIARGLVRAMGGRMWVSSAEGEGSSFVFELPAAEGR
jgi:signal transduction histidine kinase